MGTLSLATRFFALVAWQHILSLPNSSREAKNRPFGRGTTLLRGLFSHGYKPLTNWDDPPSSLPKFSRYLVRIGVWIGVWIPKGLSLSFGGSKQHRSSRWVWLEDQGIFGVCQCLVDGELGNRCHVDIRFQTIISNKNKLQRRKKKCPMFYLCSFWCDQEGSLLIMEPTWQAQTLQASWGLLLSEICIDFFSRHVTDARKKHLYCIMFQLYIIWIYFRISPFFHNFFLTTWTWYPSILPFLRLRTVAWTLWVKRLLVPVVQQTLLASTQVDPMAWSVGRFSIFVAQTLHGPCYRSLLYINGCFSGTPKSSILIGFSIK